MARGGRRPNSGRKPLHATTECLWIVQRLRNISNDRDNLENRIEQHFKRRHPTQLHARKELLAAFRTLSDTRPAQRKQILADDLGTALEESREILADEKFVSLVSLPQPNQFQMNALYKRVAQDASTHFNKHVPPRKVKDCLAAWRRFERNLEET